METLGGSQVNGAPIAPPMMSIAEIAARDGVTKPAISKAVKRLTEKHDLMVTRDGRGNVTGVNIAQYDLLRGQYGDPAHDQKSGDSKKPTYDDARTRQAFYDGERSRIKLALEIGDLVYRRDVELAMATAGEQIGRTIDQLAGVVDELAAAYTQGGLQGLRVKLKDLTHKARSDIADILEATAADAPETTPTREDPLS